MSGAAAWPWKGGEEGLRPLVASLCYLPRRHNELVGVSAVVGNSLDVHCYGVALYARQCWSTYGKEEKQLHLKCGPRRETSPSPQHQTTVLES